MRFFSMFLLLLDPLSSHRKPLSRVHKKNFASFNAFLLLLTIKKNTDNKKIECSFARDRMESLVAFRESQQMRRAMGMENRCLNSHSKMRFKTFAFYCKKLPFRCETQNSDRHKFMDFCGLARS